MSYNLVAKTLRGALFGSALTAAGVYLPSVIIDQMYLQDFHMMKVFLTASAASAIILTVLSKSYKSLKPRSPSNLGWLGSYDGNIIGGALIGVGMTLTGSCPGTVYLQVASAIASGVPVLLGGLFAGFVYFGTAPYLKTAAAKREKSDESQNCVYSKLHTDPSTTLLAFEALMMGAIVLSSQQPSAPYLLNPIVGGLLVGLSQLASVLLSGQGLGISGSYEEFGAWIWYFIDTIRGQQPKTRPSFGNIHFALSAMLGTYLMRQQFPEFAIGDSMPISNERAFLGGFLMIFGSRMAGGCTSGHGITGMSMLSVSSIISVAAMFGGGMGLGLLMRSGLIG
ncbi:hypothetical protein BT63DRAFT_417688 [Microthyrium microscopicum]|uniref:Uncharacterized protein n=1 Tax=Microthyrium microscopicum TaxID=703497 RepID=A0A6A6U1K9_9PEZI|nr:hypothetical protein BT63DRAFT_417688 [Microthyrium microscopicum]